MPNSALIGLALAVCAVLAFAFIIFKWWQAGMTAGANAANVVHETERANNNATVSDTQQKMADAGAQPVSTADDLANGKF